MMFSLNFCKDNSLTSRIIFVGGDPLKLFNGQKTKKKFFAHYYPLVARDMLIN